MKKIDSNLYLKGFYKLFMIELFFCLNTKESKNQDLETSAKN